MSGSLSIFRELYGLYHGTVPPPSLFWSCARIAFFVSAAILWGIEHRKRIDAETKMAAGKQVPAQFRLSMLEIAAQHVDRKDAASLSDIFLRARVELLQPQLADVTYRLELVSREGTEVCKWIDDVTSYHAHLTANAGVPRHEFHPLLARLIRGEPQEGWLHFVSNSHVGSTITKFGPRLIVQTENGSGNAEYPADPAIWNPLRMLVSKNENSIT